MPTTTHTARHGLVEPVRAAGGGAYATALPKAACERAAVRTHLHDGCEAPYRVDPTWSTPCDHAHFRGEATTLVSPRGIEFSLLSGAPQVVCGECRPTPASLWLVLPIVGRLRIDDPRDDVDAALEAGPGDLVRGATGQASTLMLLQDFKLLHVSVPAPLLPSRPFDLRALRAARLSGTRGVDRVFAGLLRSIADGMGEIDADQLQPVETALTEFIAVSLRTCASGDVQASARTRVFDRLCLSIESKLGDCDLSLQSFATDQYASPRYIQKLFGEAGSSFSGHLRQRRLERCRADLASRAHEASSIAEICLRWGFSDAAHFSRAFRVQFGTTPRGFRQAALALPRRAEASARA